MKLIVINNMEVELVRHVSEPAKGGKHPAEAGIDEDGRVFYKGSSGKWSLAHHTKELAENMLRTLK